MENLTPTIEIAKGISDVGVLIVITAFYLLVTGTMMIIFIRWFVKMVNQIINTQQDNLKNIYELQKQQDSKLTEIKESLNSEMLNQVRILYCYAFDFHKLCIVNIVKQIKNENNIENRDYIERKITMSLRNLFEDSKSKFSSFAYNGKKLSYYMDDKWLDMVIKNCIDEIYNEDYSEEKADKHIALLFDSIKIEFQNNLLKKQ